MDKLLTMAKTFGQELSSADKELKQVKEELKELQDLLNKHKEGTLLKFQEVEIEDLKEENEKLKKENEKLKEENKELKKEYYTEYNGETYEPWELKMELEELKEKLIEKSKSYINQCEIDLLKTKKINTLEEDNKKLKKEWDIINTFSGKMDDGQKIVDWICKFFDIEDKFIELEKENKELKKENERWEADDINLTKIISMINALDEDFSVNGVDDIYECVKELEERVEELEEHIRSELTKNMETETKPKKKKTIKKKKKKEFDYGESDDWVRSYGFQQKSSEYVINISGGGDGVSPNGFEDWVIKKVGGELKYYIRHGGNIPDEEQKEGIFPMELWSCPEGNYVSFQLPNYEPREGELSFDWLEGELDDELEDVEEKDE